MYWYLKKSKNRFYSPREQSKPSQESGTEASDLSSVLLSKQRHNGSADAWAHSSSAGLNVSPGLLWMQNIRSDHRYISATCTLSQGEFHTAHNNYTQCVLEYLLCNRSKDTKNYLRLLTRDCNKKLNFIYFRPRNVREHPKPTRFFSGISKRKLEIYSRFFSASQRI